MAFGFIGKAFKGIKKVAKKIGKGIKKIAKKVLGAIGKIGPIGQLALMFIGIPPVISNFFGGIGGAITGALGQAGTAITNFATKIAPNLTKGLGKAFNAIKTAGQGAYNTITQAIGNGVDRVMNFTKGKGFTLSGDRTSIFGGVSAKDIPVPGTVTPETAAKFGPDIPDVSDIKGDVFSSTIDASPASLTPPSSTPSLLGPDTIATDKVLAPVQDVNDILNTELFPTKETLTFGTEEATKKTLGERAKDYISEGIEGVTDTLSDPKKLAAETIKGGVISGGTTALARSIAGPPPTQKVMHSSLSDFMTPTTQRPLDAATWNNVNNAYLKAGSSFGAAGDAMTPYFTELANFDNDINYQRQMAMLNPTLNPVR
jgi:hypothetical protein